MVKVKKMSSRLIHRLIPNILKKIIGNSYIFWKFRHKISGEDVWSSYRDDFSAPRREFYSRFVKENSIRTILDFGCASGTNILRIERDLPELKLHFLGVEISQKAIDVARESCKSDCDFEQYLTLEKLQSLGNKSENGIVGLAIFDRVLTVLRDRDLRRMFEMIKGKVEYLIIDDFNSLKTISGDVWKARDFKSICINYSFELILNEDSEHIKTTDFHKSYAKRLVFKRITK